MHEALICQKVEYPLKTNIYKASFCQWVSEGVWHVLFALHPHPRISLPCKGSKIKVFGMFKNVMYHVYMYIRAYSLSNEEYVWITWCLQVNLFLKCMDCIWILIEISLSCCYCHYLLSLFKKKMFLYHLIIFRWRWAWFWWWVMLNALFRVSNLVFAVTVSYWWDAHK